MTGPAGAEDGDAQKAHKQIPPLWQIQSMSAEGGQ